MGVLETRVEAAAPLRAMPPGGEVQKASSVKSTHPASGPRRELYQTTRQYLELCPSP